MKKMTLMLIALFAANAIVAQNWNPSHPGWTDSFEANGFCWCASTNFDHDLDTKSLEINGTDYNIVTVCEELENHPLYRAFQDGDAPYNDIQCGNGPANDADDEDPITGCPGRTDLGSVGCFQIGTTFDMDWLESREMFGGETTTTTAFVPDPNKVYYIDSAIHNARLAATGESEDAYTTDENTTGSDVEWKFVAKGNGYWHIQRAAGGTKPRLRTDVSENADMQATTSSGTYTYYEITTGDITNSYFLTLPNAPVAYNRLQIDRSLDVKMVPSANHDGTWESFTITEAGTTTTSGTDVRLEAEDYDGMSGIQTENSSESGENVGWINNSDWIRFDDVNLSGLSNMDARVSSKFTGGTIEVRTGSASGTLIGSINVSNTGGDQNWTTLNTSISNTSGTQDVYLVFTGGNGYLFNINWVEFNTSSQSNKDIIEAVTVSDILIYPNPVSSTTTIINAENSIIAVYDMNGSMVLTKVISNENELIDLSVLSAGMYYGEVKGEETLSIVKIIKE